MSDTTITQEERTLWASVATARINAVTPERQCEITAQERLMKALKALEQAEAENTRLTKMVDWLAEFVFDRPCAYACCPFDKHRTGTDDDDCDKTHIQCWAEAARKSVAGEVKA